MRTALDAPPEALDEQEARVVGKIREYGWFSHDIFAEPGHKGFRFTTGFCVSVAFPELIAFTLAISHGIFGNIHQDLKDGRKFPVGRPIPDVLDGVDVVLLPVAKRHYGEHLGWSRWFYGGDDFPCLQLVYPDLANVFPWQDGFDPAWAQRQDDLSEGDWGRAVREF